MEQDTVIAEMAVEQIGTIGGNPLEELVSQLEAQSKAKMDIVLPADQIVFRAGNVEIPGVEGLFKATELCEDNISEKLDIPDTHRKAILNRFIQGGQLSGAGIFNAVTRQAQDMDIDQQFDVEAGVFQLLPKLKSMDHPLSKN